MQTNLPMLQHTLAPDLDSNGGNALTWLAFTLVFVILTGLVYPTVTTLLAGALFPNQANGSLIELGGKPVGSSLVGQAFNGQEYFIGRPSSAGKGYDPTSLSGSNLAVSNPALRERARAASDEIATREGVRPEQIPSDLIAASGSGIDPHISPAAAALQVARVAKARGLGQDRVRELVQRATLAPSFAVLGQARVNVLELNLALDAAQKP